MILVACTGNISRFETAGNQYADGIIGIWILTCICICISICMSFCISTDQRQRDNQYADGILLWLAPPARDFHIAINTITVIHLSRMSLTIFVFAASSSPSLSSLDSPARDYCGLIIILITIIIIIMMMMIIIIITITIKDVLDNIC